MAITNPSIDYLLECELIDFYTHIYEEIAKNRESGSSNANPEEKKEEKKEENKEENKEVKKENANTEDNNSDFNSDITYNYFNSDRSDDDENININKINENKSNQIIDDNLVINIASNQTTEPRIKLSQDKPNSNFSLFEQPEIVNKLFKPDLEDNLKLDEIEKDAYLIKETDKLLIYKSFDVNYNVTNNNNNNTKLNDDDTDDSDDVFGDNSKSIDYNKFSDKTTQTLKEPEKSSNETKSKKRRRRRKNVKFNDIFNIKNDLNKEEYNKFVNNLIEKRKSRKRVNTIYNFELSNYNKENIIDNELIEVNEVCVNNKRAFVNLNNKQFYDSFKNNLMKENIHIEEVINSEVSVMNLSKKFDNLKIRYNVENLKKLFYKCLYENDEDLDIWLTTWEKLKTLVNVDFDTFEKYVNIILNIDIISNIISRFVIDIYSMSNIVFSPQYILMLIYYIVRE
jgi:hypothetical protein